MNDQRRKWLSEIKTQLAELKDRIDEIEQEERECRDAVPMSMRHGRKGEALDESVEALEDAHGYVNLAMESIDRAGGKRV